jgi:N-acetylglucosamine-6-phosphate deacetylase
LEGPFLNPNKCGAHNPAHLRQPKFTAVNGWTRERGIALVTLAPELPAALELIKCLCAQGIVVSAGHSTASYEEALAGFEAGITYGTHLFNAMPTLQHRAPGLVAALLTDPRPTVGLIPDGIHLHPAMVKLVWQTIGPNRINVVSDAMAALGMQPGTYQLGDFAVTVDDTSARLVDGRLAGSTLSMDQALRNLIRYTGCPLAEALTTITTVPAQVLSLPNRGHIAPGYIADLVLLDSKLNVVKTIVNGEVVYDSL